MRVTNDAVIVRRPEEWAGLLRKRSNLFLVGPRPALDVFVVAAWPELLEPVRVAQPGQTLPLGECGTLVLSDVAALEAWQCADLLAWLRRPEARTVQIISLAETPQWQALSPALYYLLNTIYLPLAPI